MSDTDLQNLSRCDAEVARLLERRATAARRHKEALSRLASQRTAAEAKRDQELAALDAELADARAAAGKAFDALLAAKTGQNDLPTDK